MGNSTNAAYGRNPTVDSKLIDSEPGVQIYQNGQGEQFEQYLVPSNSNHLDVSYQFRINNQHPQLVDILYAGQKASVINCTSPAMFQVVTERIPYRLAHLPPQQLENALTLLRSSLLGFKDLFKVNGLICVKDTMIGVSAKNKVKVWLNPVFAVNSPEPKPLALRNLDPACHEREMINNILDLINSKADGSSIWRQFIHARQKRNLQTFEEALTLVNEFINAHKLNINDQLRNPFNKNAYGPKDQNSEIDKLEELKFNQRGGEALQDGRGQVEAASPTFQRVANAGGQAERKPNLGFAQLKNKCINPGPLKSQEPGQNPQLNSIPPQKEEKIPAEVKMPFCEKNMVVKLISPEHLNQAPHSQPNEAQKIIHRQAQPARLPFQIVNRIASRPHPSQSPRQIHSLSKKIAVKFHYSNQTPATAQSIHLGSSPTFPKYTATALSHQIIRTASQPKPICIRQVNSPPQPNSKSALVIQSYSNGQRAQREPKGALSIEEPISITQIPVNETLNMVKQPKCEEKKDHEVKKLQVSRNDQRFDSKEKQDLDGSHTEAAPHPNPSKIKDEVHEAPSYEIRVHEDTGSASQKQDQSVLEYQHSPEGSPSPKRQISLSLTPQAEQVYPQNQLFKQIARLADRPFKVVNQPTIIRQQGDKQSGRIFQGSKQENSLTDSKELKKSQGSPRNDSGMGSSIMGRNKLPKVSYKEMRKMLLQTLQEY